jgi:hypothetical protein
MVKLYEITASQAEAMSAAYAAKLLAEEEEESGNHGEAWDRSLAAYALEWDGVGNNSPLKDKDGKYILNEVDSGDAGNAPTVWRYWAARLPDKKMMKLGYSEAFSLRPKVKKILEKKVHATIGQFKEHASEETKRKYEAADEGTKGTILSAWLKAHGHPPMDGGRRKSRRSRKTRSTRALTARRRV